MSQELKLWVTAGTWTPEELKEMDQTLATLPKSFIQCSSRISKAAQISYQGGDAMGLAWPSPNDELATDIWISQQLPEEIPGTLVHEMTHSLQGDRPEISQEWERAFWKDHAPVTPPVNDYGNTNPSEDMCEAARFYWTDGPSLAKKDPKRYAFLGDKVFAGVEYKVPNGVLEQGLDY